LGWEMKQPLIPLWSVLGMRNEATPDSVMKRFGDEKWSNPWFCLVIHPQNVTSPDVTDSSMGGGKVGRELAGAADYLQDPPSSCTTEASISHLKRIIWWAWWWRWWCSFAAISLHSLLTEVEFSSCWVPLQIDQSNHRLRSKSGCGRGEWHTVGTWHLAHCFTGFPLPPPPKTSVRD
jgi:hypothetical protein